MSSLLTTAAFATATFFATRTATADSIAKSADDARAASLPTFGVRLDVGVPAAGVMLVDRPRDWLRINGGLAYNYVGYGVRGGVSLAPFRGPVTPTLDLDAGRFLSGDVTRLGATGTPAELALMRDARYDFASAQVGLEIGSQRHFSFFVRGGVSYVAASASGALVSNLVNERIDNTMVSASVRDAHMKALIPSASAGFVLYFR